MLPLLGHLQAVRLSSLLSKDDKLKAPSHNSVWGVKEPTSVKSRGQPPIWLDISHGEKGLLRARVVAPRVVLGDPAQNGKPR